MPWDYSLIKCYKKVNHHLPILNTRYSGLKLVFILAIFMAISSCDDDEGGPMNQTINLTLSMSQLNTIGDDVVMALWLVMPDGYHLLGQTTVYITTNGRFLTKTKFPISQAIWSENQGAVISLEPVGQIGEQPGAHRFLAGDFDGRSIKMTIDDERALDIDLSDRSCGYIMSSPTDGDTLHPERGIWMFDPSSDQSAMNMPILPPQWSYQSWLLYQDTAYSMGYFVDPTMADDSDYFSSDIAAGYNVPGEDFIHGDSRLPADLRSELLLVSIEPIPDFDPDVPFIIRPFLVTLTDTVAQQTVYTSLKTESIVRAILTVD